MVPLGYAFHERDAEALGGFRDEQVGLAIGVVDGVEGAYDVVHGVAVHRHDIPSEGRPALAYVVKWHDVLGIAADLQMVAVDDGHEVVELILVGGHSSFVDTALALLAVAHKDVGAVAVRIHLGGQCHAYADAQAVAQCTAVHLDAWHLDSRVAAEDAAELSQRVEYFRLEKTFRLQRDVERLHAVSLREHEAVSVGCLGVGGVETLHHVEIECRHHIEARKVAADVPRLGAVDNLHQAFAALFGQQLQFFCIHRSEKRVISYYKNR